MYFLGNNLMLSLSIIAGGKLLALAGAQAGLPMVPAGLEPWRLALIFSAFAAPLLIVLTLLIPLPRRIAAAKDAMPVQGVLDFYRAHPRALFGVFFGFGIIYAAPGTMNIWFAIALTRVFAVPPAAVEPPAIVSESFSWEIGTPFFAYVSCLRLVLSTLRSALTETCALPGPSDWMSSALSLDCIVWA